MIDTILFDMGNTLLEFEPRPFPDLHAEALAAVAEAAHADGLIAHDRVPGFTDAFGGVWNEIARAHEPNGGQPHLGEAFAGLFERWGIAITPEQIERLEAVHYSGFRDRLERYDDVLGVLDACRARGLRLALISNTIWIGDWHREDLVAFGLDGYFDFMVFSREFGRMKPHPSIFHAAIDALDTAPERALVVGDRVSADVAGARAAGCPVLLRRHPLTYEASPRAHEPDAEIDGLSDVLPWIDARGD